MSRVTPFEATAATIQGTSSASDSQFAAMEKTQAQVKFTSRVPPFEAGASIPRTHVSIPMNPEIDDLVNAINLKLTGNKSIARRIHELRQRLGISIETYIENKKVGDSEKKKKIEKGVSDQQSIKGWQAWAKALGGFGGGILSIMGPMFGGQVGNVLSAAARFAPSVGDTLYTSQEASAIPLQFQQSHFLNTVQSNKQATEGLKGVLRQLQEQSLQVAQQEKQATGAIFR